MIKLSIIVPVYNVEPYIRKCLESVFVCDVPLDIYEVIIVNDGTPDNSMSIVCEFAEKYRNLKMIHQENQGLSGARNTGLRQAQGEYVWFVDSDDTINRLPELIELIKSEEDIYVFNITEIEETSGIKRTKNIFSKKVPEGVTSGIELLMKNVNIVPVQRVVMKRTFLIKNNLSFYPKIYHEDIEFAVKLLFFAKKVKVSELAFYNYLIRTSGSITSNYSSKRIEDLQTIIFSIDEFCVQYKIKGILLRRYREKQVKLIRYMTKMLSTCNDKNQKTLFQKKIKKLSRKHVIFSCNIKLTFLVMLLCISPYCYSIYRKIREL